MNQPQMNQPGEPEGQQTPGDPGQHMSPEAIERLAKQLQQYAKDHMQGQQNQQDAQRLRRQAEEVLKNMTPEERQTLENVARDLAEQNKDQGKQSDEPNAKDQHGRQEPRTPSANADNGAQQSGDGQAGTTGDGAGTGPRRNNPRRVGAEAAPTQTEPVDARGQPKTDPSEHVIADYFNNKPSPRTGAPGPTLQQGVSDAAKGAERAIEQQAVPSQYSDLVRRVFRRYVERVQPGAGQDAPAPAPK
jgi:hypothetical protein